MTDLLRRSLPHLRRMRFIASPSNHHDDPLEYPDAYAEEIAEWRAVDRLILDIEKAIKIGDDWMRDTLSRSGDIDLTECKICGRPCFVPFNDGLPCCSECGDDDQ